MTERAIYIMKLTFMRFSGQEKQDLLKAWIAISLAFAILRGGILSYIFLAYFIISLLTVGIGFLLHELAHKFVALHFRCRAEFRADDRMLVFAVVSSFLGFVFAAPGAVMIQGNVTAEKNGKISLAGPAANLALAVIFLAGFLLVQKPGIIPGVLYEGFHINSLIALFNMLPFMNFDGAKILRWNKAIYVGTVFSASTLFFLTYLLPA